MKGLGPHFKTGFDSLALATDWLCSIMNVISEEEKERCDLRELKQLEEEGHIIRRRNETEEEKKEKGHWYHANGIGWMYMFADFQPKIHYNAGGGDE